MIGTTCFASMLERSSSQFRWLSWPGTDAGAVIPRNYLREGGSACLGSRYDPEDLSRRGQDVDLSPGVLAETEDLAVGPERGPILLLGGGGTRKPEAAHPALTVVGVE